MTKIIAITSSPRRHGNSEILIDKFIESAKANGADVEKVVLNELNLNACQNCGGCFKTGRCILKDDIFILNDKILKADHIVLATPIFMGSLCAQLKTLIDRGQPFWVNKYVLKKEPDKKSRHIILLCTAGFDQKTYPKRTEQFKRNSTEIFDIYALILNATEKTVIYVDGMNKPEAILQKTDIIKQCEELGKTLAE